MIFRNGNFPGLTILMCYRVELGIGVKIVSIFFGHECNLVVSMLQLLFLHNLFTSIFILGMVQNPLLCLGLFQLYLSIFYILYACALHNSVNDMCTAF
jgi:hypothetical protein